MSNPLTADVYRVRGGEALNVSVRLIAAARARGMMVCVCAGDKALARDVSNAAWSYQGGASFLAHGVEGDVKGEDPARHPVWIAHEAELRAPGKEAPALALSLGGVAIAPQQGFARLACVVDAEDSEARLRAIDLLTHWQREREATTRWFVQGDNRWIEEKQA